MVRFLVDGADIEDARAYARIVFVFDGRDEEAVSQARAAWQKAKADGYKSAIGNRTPRDAGSKSRELAL